MRNTTTCKLVSLLLALNAASVFASFESTDFELILQGYDTDPPHAYFSELGINYEVWIVNHSDQTAVFGDNLFGPSGSSTTLLINGVALSDSPAYLGSFSAVDNDYDDGVIEPGESYYLGGFILFFDPTLLPNVSVVELISASLQFRNSEPLGQDIFDVHYQGDPLANTITTPIPAVGLALFPLLVLMKLIGRRPQKR